MQQNYHDPMVIQAIQSRDLITLANLFAQPKKYPSNALNEAGESYLHAAARHILAADAPYGLNIIEFLLKAGINPELTNSTGKRAIEVGDINALDKDFGCTPLQQAIRHNDLENIFDWIFKANPDVNKPSRSDSTAVWEAAFFAKLNILLSLVERSANIYVGYGFPLRANPLLAALNSTSGTSEQRRQCVQYLLNKHAGISLLFSKGELDNIDLTGKVLLAAEFPNGLSEKNPTFAKAIKTIKDLENAVKESKITSEQLREIKIACCYIRNDLLINYGQEQSLPLFKLINQLDLKWPELKAVGIEVPANIRIDPQFLKRASEGPKSDGCLVM